MKHNHIIPILACMIVLAHGTAGACDLCSCLMGINPYYTSLDNITLHVLLQSSHSTPVDQLTGIGGSKTLMPGHITAMPGTFPQLYHSTGDGHQVINERRITFEMGYQHHFSEQFMAVARLPYTVAEEEFTGGNMAVQGIGDPAVLLYYVVSDILPGDIPSTLLLGGGAELPLGRHDLRDDHGTELHPRIQPGSGTVDLVLNAQATARFGDEFSAAVDINGKISGKDGDNNRFGNSAALSTTLTHNFYRDNDGRCTLMAAAGARAELAGKDRIHGVIDQASGFATTYGTVGGAMLYGRMKLDFSVLFPLAQSRMAGVPSEGARFLVGTRLEL